MRTFLYKEAATLNLTGSLIRGREQTEGNRRIDNALTAKGTGYDKTVKEPDSP